jgi:NADPH-dependent glutamate synthase beta subunit-like oxidoreductase
MNNASIAFIGLGVLCLATNHVRLGLGCMIYVLLGIALKRNNRATDDITKGINLSGRVAIVTGASAGIGLTTAAALWRAGAHVIVCARSVSKGSKK